jgi:hypothetical protein
MQVSRTHSRGGGGEAGGESEGGHYEQNLMYRRWGLYSLARTDWYAVFERAVNGGMRSISRNLAEDVKPDLHSGEVSQVDLLFTL